MHVTPVMTGLNFFQQTVHIQGCIQQTNMAITRLLVVCQMLSGVLAAKQVTTLMQ